MRTRIKLLAVLALVAGALFGAKTVWALCAPEARGIFPASGVVGTQVGATVSGSGLAGAIADVFGEPGLTVSVQTASDTTVSLNLTIAADAAPGERIISLSTPGGIVAVDFTVNPAGGPILTSVAPPPFATQGLPLALVVSGQNLAGISSANVAVSGNGVTVDTATPSGDGTSLNLSLSVAADADLGTHAVTISTATGGGLLQLYVRRPAPAIAQISPGAGAVGTVVPLTITGSHLTGSALVITSGASGNGGVTISQVATPDDSTLTATLTISTLTPETEPRLLIVTNESGQATAEFFVVAAGVPSITTVRPGAGSPGQTVTGVVLRGLHFTGAAVTASAQLTPQNVVVVDDETITLDVAVNAAAPVNTNHTITVTVPSLAPANATFRVIALNAPFIGTVNPPFANRGDTATILLQGVNLSTVVVGTGVDISSSGIVESNTLALNDFTVRTILAISPNANAGIRDVTVTTANGAFTKQSSFRVNIPGQVPTITDVTPRVVEPGTTTNIAVSGSGFVGAGVSVGGPGSVVTNIVVTGDTLVTFDLTLASDASAENRPLIVVTENGSATCGILTLAPTIVLRAPKLVRTGAVLEVLTAGYRLFLFEFSLNERFDSGVRTCTASSGAQIYTLLQGDAERIGRAVRDLPFGYLRVRAVTATNQIGSSAAIRFRR